MFLPVLRCALEVLRRGERRVAMRGKVLGVLGRPCGSLRGEVRLEVGPGVWLIPKTAELRMFSHLLRSRAQPRFPNSRSGLLDRSSKSSSSRAFCRSFTSFSIPATALRRYRSSSIRDRFSSGSEALYHKKNKKSHAETGAGVKECQEKVDTARTIYKQQESPEYMPQNIL
ncbi:hypothetical protein E2C01_011910 [Portunus trituberculatus]|uniref:Uncharacterized protein n=1 Tax=Portunus trituberculatus TaxID=210409 RepID=A0A5B7DD38_PORTR|nr:hypothetical protein [Portunus trituberculatus]